MMNHCTHYLCGLCSWNPPEMRRSKRSFTRIDGDSLWVPQQQRFFSSHVCSPRSRNTRTEPGSCRPTHGPSPVPVPARGPGWFLGFVLGTLRSRLLRRSGVVHPVSLEALVRFFSPVSHKRSYRRSPKLIRSTGGTASTGLHLGPKPGSEHLSQVYVSSKKTLLCWNNSR